MCYVEANIKSLYRYIKVDTIGIKTLVTAGKVSKLIILMYWSVINVKAFEQSKPQNRNRKDNIILKRAVTIVQ